MPEKGVFAAEGLMALPPDQKASPALMYRPHHGALAAPEGFPVFSRAVPDSC